MNLLRRLFHRSGLMLLGAVYLGGCASLQPVPYPFELVGAQGSFIGKLYPASRTMEVTIENKPFSGYYIQSVSRSVSDGLLFRRGLMDSVVTTTFDNNARGVLSAADGDRLFCDFLFEGMRMLGECKHPGAASYSLVSPPR